MPTTPATWAGVFVAVVSPGCAATAEPPEAVIVHEATYESATLVVRPNPDLPLCGGSIAFMEDFVAAVAASLPAGVEPSGPVTLQYLSQPELAQEGLCSIAGLKCARRGHAYTTDAVDLHELTHAVREVSYDGFVPGAIVLEEGLAVLHSSETLDFPAAHLPQESLSHIDINDPIRGASYSRAGHFSAYLSEQAGHESFVAFVGASQAVETVDDYAATYAAATGRSWTDDLSAYADYPDCDLFALARRPVECGDDARAVRLDGQQPIHELVDLQGYGCGSPEASGPIRDRIWNYAVVDVDDVDDTTWFLDLVAEIPDDAGFEVQVVSCAGGCRAPEFDAFASTERDLFEAIRFEPGRSVVRFAQNVDVTSNIHIRMTAM